jgi:NAD(P)-dependent dehydrogenase (short-subunit alcohol dehydrogenase family)
MGAELILSDRDEIMLGEAAHDLSSFGLACDVSSEASVSSFAREIHERYSWLDMVINAAGGGYERTLGMYRVSRALLPSLQQGTHRLLLNVPPTPEEAETAIFPYASSRLAFQRLSSALAFETRSVPVTVLIACPTARRATGVLPDPNAGNWAETCRPGPASEEDIRTLAWNVASLVGRHAASTRQAG